jgi:UDP-N-acetylmuramoylalanine--D-glutamate ligase
MLKNELILFLSYLIVKIKNRCHDEFMMDADIKKIFSGKKITLMGLGLLGRGVGDAEFLAEAGAELTITDLKSKLELAPSLERLQKFPNIAYHLGGHRLEDFERRDMVLRAPNAPLDSLFIAHAREYGIPIEMDASLFAKLSGTTIVGVTGTRGKSTVTHLIYEMAKAAGKKPSIGGNERDTATLQLLKTTEKGGLAVLELDSWQLQGFEEDKISPHVAVWTNFMPDHMNYYKGDMDRYFRDKTAIARFQHKGDCFITTPDIKKRIEAQFGPLRGTCVTDAAIPDDWKINLPGEHNRRNAACARAAAHRLGISDEIVKKVLETFAGLPGRLEPLGEKNGVAFYDDANSTTPEAGIAALRAIAATGRPIVLIAGGSDKEMQFKEFADEIAKSAKNAILFQGKATEKLQPLLPTGFPVTLVSSMKEAFAAALTDAKQGDIILLSPGATSFGIFKNEYDRGDQFREMVNNL